MVQNSRYRGEEDSSTAMHGKEFISDLERFVTVVRMLKEGRGIHCNKKKAAFITVPSPRLMRKVGLTILQ